MFLLVGIYVLLGGAGFAVGTAQDPSADVPGATDPRLLRVIPGALELGTVDHVVHILLGAIYLVGGWWSSRRHAGA